MFPWLCWPVVPPWSWSFSILFLPLGGSRFQATHTHTHKLNLFSGQISLCCIIRSYNSENALLCLFCERQLVINPSTEVIYFQPVMAVQCNLSVHLSFSNLPHRISEANFRARRLRLLPQLQSRAHHGAAHTELGQAKRLLPEQLSRHHSTMGLWVKKRHKAGQGGRLQSLFVKHIKTPPFPLNNTCSRLYRLSPNSTSWALT